MLGYWLLEDALGQGYASEAVEALTRLLLRTEAMVRLEIECDNVASLRLARRLSFVYEGACEVPWPGGESRPGERWLRRAVTVDHNNSP